ncbi:MAG: serine acetyltransferase, partial [Kosmotoga sp.]
MNKDFRNEKSNTIKYIYKEIAKTHCSSKPHSLGNVKRKTIELIHLIRRTICPQLSQDDKIDGLESLSKTIKILERLIRDILPHVNEEEVSKITTEFLNELPAVAKKLVLDVRAAYEGDPAAQSIEEIMIAYPAYEA